MTAFLVTLTPIAALALFLFRDYRAECRNERTPA